MLHYFVDCITLRRLTHRRRTKRCMELMVSFLYIPSSLHSSAGAMATDSTLQHVMSTFSQELGPFKWLHVERSENYSGSWVPFESFRDRFVGLVAPGCGKGILSLEMMLDRGLPLHVQLGKDTVPWPCSSFGLNLPIWRAYLGLNKRKP